MTPDLFLACALALPLSMVPPSGSRQFDVSIFKFLVNSYHRFHGNDNIKSSRIYVMGGDDDLLFSLRNNDIQTWRITIDPHTPFDIVAFPNAIPLARESGLIVIYMLEIKYDAWGSMRLFSEATYPLCQGGILAFYEKFSPYFPALAKASGFERIPFEWYEMQLWRKPQAHARHRLFDIKGSA